MRKSGFINKRGASEIILGGLVGFLFFWLTSHQKSPVNKKLPQRKYKRFYYSPNIKVERADKHYHLHHWALFSIFYLPFLMLRRRFRLNFLHGFFIGTILQGLTYKDRFEFIKPLGDFAQVIDAEPILEPQEKK